MAELTQPGSIPVGQISPPGTANPVGTSPNPLEKYFRQPKLYIALPSKGHYYPKGAIELPGNGEVPIYSLTARDELVLKTPDALLNGASTTEVIQSCCPSIKDAWEMPSIDLDTVLIAMRIATYGEKLTITSKIPNVKPVEEKDFELDLRTILDQFANVNYENVCEIGSMKITIRPQTYREFTETAIKTFEEQRLFQVVADDELKEEEKLARFQASFKKLTSLTVNLIAKSIVQVQDGDTVVVNRDHINEFIQKADKNFYKTITDHIEKQRDKFQLEPMKVQSTADEVKRGAPAEYTIPVAFDHSSFFV